MRILALAAVTLALSACGGGGSDDDGDSANTGEATVDAAGGELATTSGTARAVFPTGAVAASTAVTVKPAKGTPDSDRIVGGTAYEFGPALIFTKPVAMTLKYDPAKLPEGALESRLVLYTLEGGVWKAVADSRVDTATHTVSAPVSHFSAYAVLADNQFAGHYAGPYSGTFDGSWMATVDVDGNIEATATGGFSGRGNVNFTGRSTVGLAGSGSSAGETVTFEGSFTLQTDGVSVLGQGTWSSASGHGDWSGEKLDE